MAFNLDNYETVDDRLHRFYETHPQGRILTSLEHTGLTPEGKLGQVIMRAEVFRSLEDLVPSASGFAEEVLSATGVNRTSFVENCETSAIGRALANLGFSPRGARPSREEMVAAETHRVMADDTQAVDPGRVSHTRDLAGASTKQLGMIRGLATAKGWPTAKVDAAMKGLSKLDASTLIDRLQKEPDMPWSDNE